MAAVRVIIIGAGIAGPVLAVFLKGRGYDPIIYDRLPSAGEGGLSHMLQPNGLRVLALIPELLDQIPGRSPERIIHSSFSDGKEVILVDHDISSDIRKIFGFPIIGVQRADFQRLLTDTAAKHHIQIKWGHHAISFEQNDRSVQVTFANGTQDTASFVVGCDGLHSNTRIALFGKEKADFTGLVQFGGLSPTPPALPQLALVNNYGIGWHMITYPVAEDKHAWAITTREADSQVKENWDLQCAEQLDRIRTRLHSAWGCGAGDLVKSSQKIIKYGLYDRPELSSWFKGRIVLLGDAAHPTSPHLGQGANQALEDIYHLIRLLKKHNPTASQPSTELLSQIFADYQDLRIPRTSELVKGARQQGQLRVVEGIDACRKRDGTIRAGFNDDAAQGAYHEVLSGPFKDSEI